MAAVAAVEASVAAGTPQEAVGESRGDRGGGGGAWLTKVVAVVESGVAGFSSRSQQMSGELSRVPVLPVAVVSADRAAGGLRIGMKADLTTSIGSSSESSSLADDSSPLLVSWLAPAFEPVLRERSA